MIQLPLFTNIFSVHLWERLSYQELAQMLQLIPDPVLFDGLSEEEKYQWIQYLYAYPRAGTQTLNLKDRIISLYDPFAARKDFPAGRRWCVNVYVGCAFSCKYCYIISYIRDSFQPREKKNFRNLLERDLKAIQRLKLHPAPIHISNSTDPLQHLEYKYQHTLFLLQQLLEYRKYFTTITILTKNPAMLCNPEYLNIVKRLNPFQVEVTCPFFRDEIRKAFEPGAPSVENRLEAIRNLREKNIQVALRLDPVFPREPLPEEFFNKQFLKDYNAPQSHTEEDIIQLIQFASQVGCKSVIVSPLKLIIGKMGKSELVSEYIKLYAAANNGKVIKKGPAYRMPWRLYHDWLKRPMEVAKSSGIPLIYCKNNLFKTC